MSSILDGVGIFYFLNPSGHTMTLWSTQRLKEMSTTDISRGGKGGRCIGLTTLPTLCANFLEILGASTPWKNHRLSRTVIELLSLFFSNFSKGTYFAHFSENVQ
jgi:hypothetical protein